MLNRNEEVEKIFRAKADSSKPSVFSELLCCPFCGGGAVVESTDKSNIFWRTKCLACHAQATTTTSKEKAIIFWNRRAT